MLRKYFPVIALLFSIAVGGGVAALALWLLPRTDFPPQHPLYQRFGIQKPEVIGFFPYWLLSKTDKDYSPYLTNFTYFGLVVNGDGSIQQRAKPTEEEPGWNKLRSDLLKQQLARAREKKMEASLLLHASGEAGIQKLIEDPVVNALRLTNEVLPLMDEYGYTDLNVDIESFATATSSARAAFTTFVSEIKNELQKTPGRTLTVEITPSSLVNDNLTNPAEIGRVADRVVLMAYDYHYRGSFVSGPVAPVGGSPEIREQDVTRSIQEALKVIPREKLILGIPVYGYEWETISRLPGAAVIPGTGKTATHQRVEELLKNCVHCEQGINPVSQQPYLILPATEEGYSQQIFYENEESLQMKLNLARKHRLRGVAFWAIGYEGEKFLEPVKSYKRSFEWDVPITTTLAP